MKVFGLCKLTACRSIPWEPLFKQIGVARWDDSWEFGEAAFGLLLSNASFGVSHVISYPCICWHYKSALYLVMGCIPVALWVSLGWCCLWLETSKQDLCTCIWHGLVGYRKVTHSHMRLFQARLEVFTEYFQPDFPLKSAAEHWLSQVYAALSNLPV